MAHIHFQHNHSMGAKAAKARVEGIAENIKSRFGVKYGWQGNTLSFNRSGVNGTIDVDDNTVTIDAELGMMYSAFKGQIESQLKSYMDSNFS
jgi:putative polyhydroxyalkanoate system protein